MKIKLAKTVLSILKIRTTAERESEKLFYELAWPHINAVFRTAQCLTHDNADAEDLVQETMFKAFKSIHTIRDGSQVKPWLMTILRRTRIDQLRATRVEPSQSEIEVELSHGSVDETWISDSRLDPEKLLNCMNDETIIDALRNLPKTIRWALLLVDVEGMDHQDAAAALDIPIGTVKSRLHRGRAMLRTSLWSRSHVLIASAPVTCPENGSDLVGKQRVRAELKNLIAVS
jgi:RNA polymerase sigma-70 factor (ECF subfamily)